MSDQTMQALHELMRKIRPYLAMAGESLAVDRREDATGVEVTFALDERPDVRPGRRYVMLLVEIDDDEACVPAGEDA